MKNSNAQPDNAENSTNQEDSTALLHESRYAADEIRRLRAELEQAMVALRGMNIDEKQDRGLLALGKRMIDLEKQLAEANIKLRPMSCGHPRACEDESAPASVSYIGEHGEQVVSGCGWREANAALSECRNQHTIKDAHAQAELKAANAARDTEAAIVDRLWKAVGIQTYEQAKGKAIDEIVSDLKYARERVEGDLAETRNTIGQFFRGLKALFGYKNWPEYTGKFNDGVLREIKTLLDKLARAEALIAKWRKFYIGAHACSVMRQCADELEQVLKGDSHARG